MKPHLRFYTFTINYIFMGLSTNNKESKTMTEMKLENQLDLSSFMTRVCLPALGPDRAPVRIGCSDEVRWVPRKVWRTTVSSVTFLRRVCHPWWELPSFHSCSEGNNAFILPRGFHSPSSPTLLCWEIVGPSPYHMSLIKYTLTLWPWQSMKRVEAKLSFNFGM